MIGHILSARRLAEILKALPEGSWVTPDLVGNLAVIDVERERQIGYIDFAGEGKWVPLDDLEDLRDGPTQGITCRYCGTTGLLWHEEAQPIRPRDRTGAAPTGDPLRIWRLVDARGRHHFCTHRP